MTDNEILREYRTAKSPKKQIKILADLYPSIGERGIYEALIRCGEDIKIPKRLLTDKEKEQEEEHMEEAKVTPVQEEEKPVEKVDGRKKPWSDERREAIREGKAKAKASREAEIKEWKPMKFDAELELPTAVLYVMTAGMQSVLKEMNQSLKNAATCIRAYNESVDFFESHGITGRFTKLDLKLPTEDVK